ncbi:MAG: uracil-DNA glycosylase [Bacilli bacterium]|nr:uracil-DNA glycosylase [Bacilli bacterium]
MISSWAEFFESVKGKEYSKRLKSFLDQEYATHQCFPPRSLMFNAFELTDPKTLKVVIIGQDPYHNDGQAMGLSFSVPRGMDLPPSLRNIYREIESDVGIQMDYSSGDLTPWAKQGVLLYNARLSVRAHTPLSHSVPEYDEFTADLMKYLDGLPQTIVFLLWGSFAKKFRNFIVNPQHFAIESNHPSPMSANRGGWFGQRPFSRCNSILTSHGASPIDWKN